MKKLYFFFICLILTLASISSACPALAQAPQSFNYQAVARDASGNPLVSKTVGLELSILDGSPTGAVVYTETFSPATNSQGLFTVAVGTGHGVTGTFSAINWATGGKYLRTGLDPNGGSNYTITGTAELLSVPYALYAASAAGGTAGSGQWTTTGNNITNANSGNVGISTGTAGVNNLLQIGDAPSFSDNYLAMGNGTQASSFAFESGTTTWYSNNNFALMPFESTGYVGIGTLSPVNKLQIGTPPGFSANDLAIGNGTQGTSFALSSSAVTWFSNVPFALMPAGGTGNVGIGMVPSATSLYKMTIQANNGSGLLVQGSGRAAIEASSGDLDIDNGNASINGDAIVTGDLSIGGSDGSAVPLTITNSSYGDNFTGSKASLTGCNFCGTGYLSIDARVGDVWANAFFATSDARVKNIIGISDAATDLDKLNHIRVTDYSMKDTLLFGQRRFKKVIAQQVEEVYPQVIQKQKGFIPNVYQETIKMERIDSGYLLTFGKPHHLSAGAARLRLQAAGSMKPYTILSIPSDHEVVIQSSALKATRAFVYGEEVDDFRSVDYEGLTTLNISATQELSRLVKQQAQAISLLKKQVRTLEAKVSSQKSATLEPSSVGK